jgi:hypothetical protein
VHLIETSDRRGTGRNDDPVRMVRQWWTLDGEFVVEAPDRCAATPKEAADGR